MLMTTSSPISFWFRCIDRQLRGYFFIESLAKVPDMYFNSKQAPHLIPIAVSGMNYSHQCLCLFIISSSLWGRRHRATVQVIRRRPARDIQCGAWRRRILLERQLEAVAFRGRLHRQQLGQVHLLPHVQVHRHAPVAGWGGARVHDACAHV